MTKIQEFLTVKDAADMLGVSPNTIRNWDQSGKIPVYRNPLTGYRLFKRDDLKRLLKRIEDSGYYPTGWRRPKSRNRKPR